jgi:exopolyphosphatase/guanosine-5'-triphosphate,3'-diphosphate pyrophosphatase
MKHIAAFDIGSNAVRLSIASLDGEGNLDILERIRFPLRLGTEVFREGKFSDYLIEEAVRVFKEFKKHLNHYNVEYSKAIATSAFRNAENGSLLREKVLSETGIFIQEIDGKTEAQYIRHAIETQINLSQKDYLLFDIGGGSAEFTFLKKGEVIGAKSFPIGTVRLLELGKNALEQGLSVEKGYQIYLDEIRPELKNFLREVYPHTKPIRVIGTGGNFKRLTRLRKKILGKKNIQYVLPEEVPLIREALQKTPYLKRIKKFGLRPDRADVIIPALYIIESAIEFIPVKKILTPDLGLIHGLLEEIAKEVSGQSDESSL